MNTRESPDDYEVRKKDAIEQIFNIIKTMSGLPGVTSALKRYHKILSKIQPDNQDIIDLAQQIINKTSAPKQEIQQIAEGIQRTLISLLNPIYRGTQIFKPQKKNLEETFLEILSIHGIEESEAGIIAQILWAKTTKEILRID